MPIISVYNNIIFTIQMSTSLIQSKYLHRMGFHVEAFCSINTKVLFNRILKCSTKNIQINQIFFFKYIYKCDKPQIKDKYIQGIELYNTCTLYLSELSLNSPHYWDEYLVEGTRCQQIKWSLAKSINFLSKKNKNKNLFQ